MSAVEAADIKRECPHPCDSCDDPHTPLVAKLLAELQGMLERLTFWTNAAEQDRRESKFHESRKKQAQSRVAELERAMRGALRQSHHEHGPERAWESILRAALAPEEAPACDDCGKEPATHHCFSVCDRCWSREYDPTAQPGAIDPGPCGCRNLDCEECSSAAEPPINLDAQPKRPPEWEHHGPAGSLYSGRRGRSMHKQCSRAAGR